MPTSGSGGTVLRRGRPLPDVRPLQQLNLRPPSDFPVSVGLRADGKQPHGSRAQRILRGEKLIRSC